MTTQRIAAHMDRDGTVTQRILSNTSIRRALQIRWDTSVRGTGVGSIV